jgi:hypothetical protein
MAIKVDRINGQNYAENLVNPVLSFNTGTWSVISGTGTSVLNNKEVFEGVTSLRVQNNTPASDLTVSNTNQTTTIDIASEYQISWYLRKDFALEEREVDVLIYQNAVLLDTQSCVIGSTDADFDDTDVWVRFQADRTYDLLVNDEITFQFKLKSSATLESETVIYIDALMLNLAERGNNIVPFYTKPEFNKQVFGIYNYQDDGNSTTTVAVANSWYTVENNGLGVFSSSVGGFDGIEPYDAVSKEFDLSDLDLYDEIEIRLDLKATTNTSNDTVLFRLNIANGAAFLNLYSKEYDVSTTDDQIVIYIPVGVLSELAKTNGFKLECSSNTSGTTVDVNGYYVKVNKRFI